MARLSTNLVLVMGVVVLAAVAKAQDVPAAPDALMPPDSTASAPPAATAAAASSDAEDEGGWRLARATYYGAPESFARRYDPKRGEGSFGILAFGSCGYTNSDGSLPFPRDAYAAAADANADYPGSCGRCYEIKCRPGLVLNNDRQPIRIVAGEAGRRFFEGDTMRPYLPDIDTNATDPSGRPWPGNAAEASGEQAVVCAPGDATAVVRIADSCPCTQVLPDGAPGVAKGGETRRQQWCCGGVEHFDLSFDAFAKLAHPVYGVAMLSYRPVDCDTGAPLPFSPGYVSPVVYSGGPRAGSGWQTYRGSYFRLVSADERTPAGNAATCAALTPAGGLYFESRNASRPGYRPFEGARSLDFWIKLPLKMFLKGESDNYCGAEPALPDLTPASAPAAGGWVRYSVPLEAFNCSSLGDMTRLEFQNARRDQGAGGDADFCLGDLKIAK